MVLRGGALSSSPPLSQPTLVLCLVCFRGGSRILTSQRIISVLHQVEAQSNSLPPGFLLYTDTSRDNIYVMDLQGMREYLLPITGFKNPIACDYDPLKQVFFLLERSTTIQSSEKYILLVGSIFINIDFQRLPGRKYIIFL